MKETINDAKKNLNNISENKIENENKEIETNKVAEKKLNQFYERLK